MKKTLPKIEVGDFVKKEFGVSEYNPSRLARDGSIFVAERMWIKVRRVLKNGLSGDLATIPKILSRTHMIGDVQLVFYKDIIKVLSADGTEKPILWKDE